MPTFTYAEAQRYWKDDLVAGLTVSSLVVPQSMAYAMLAGLPPEYGLYTSLLPVIVYSLLSSSQSTNVGTFALASLILGQTAQSYLSSDFFAATNPMPMDKSELYIRTCLQFSFLAGVVQLVLGTFHFTRLIDPLLPPALINGFTSSAALHIGSSQLGNITGISIPTFGGFFTLPRLWTYFFQHIARAHLLTCAVGFGSILLILGIRQINATVASQNALSAARAANNAITEATSLLPGHIRREVRRCRFPPIPDILVTIVIVTAVSFAFHLGRYGVAITGTIPQGLPSFSVGWMVGMDTMGKLPGALVLAGVGYVMTIAIGKHFAMRFSRELSESRELVALGFSTMVGVFFQGYINSGSLTRSVVLVQAGGKTAMASVYGSFVVALTLVAFTPLFYHMPLTVLAAVVLVACTGLLAKVSEGRRLWRENRWDFTTWAATYLAVVLLSVEMGILVGMATALLIRIIREIRLRFRR